jgi:hypothetical protein
MDAVVKPKWRYLRRPLTGIAQIYRSDERTTGYPHHRLPKNEPTVTAGDGPGDCHQAHGHQYPMHPVKRVQ